MNLVTSQAARNESLLALTYQAQDIMLLIQVSSQSVRFAHMQEISITNKCAGLKVKRASVLND